MDALKALAFAAKVHLGQTRRYTGEEYFQHLAEVAGIVSTVRRDEITIATAYLHDCVEDQGVKAETLLDMFGHDVTAGVLFLSDLEQGNRAARKAASRARLSAAPAWVQDIKVADVISNARSIIKHDAAFAGTFTSECRMLLAAMTLADRRLVAYARDTIGGHL
jgi:guanosine-3',5'-bis(diphosphate) 3'-pyrophosphohydrolase